MSFVFAVSESYSDAVNELSAIGSTIDAAHAAAAAPTTGILTAAGGNMEFGPDPLPSYASVTGAPVTTLDVQINGGAQRPTGYAFIDSGGVYGSRPTALNPPDVGGYVPAGTSISVYTTGGTLLYTTTVGPQQTTVVSSLLGGDFNTGFVPFLQDPIYLSYSPTGFGTTYFDT